MTDTLIVEGSHPLNGTVELCGAKNSITKLLVASLLSDTQCTFYNVPEIGDVEITVELCQELGMQVNWDRSEKKMVVQTPHLKTSYIPQRFSGSNRIPILMIGALLARTHEDIIVPTVGGCHIGTRPIDFHIHSLEKLGAKIEYRKMHREGAYFASAHQGLAGAIIELDFPSVGATENTILAAVRAKGTTVIRNAATEPEIVDLILFLQKLGAIISLDVDRTIYIQGTNHFYNVEHTVIPDRIVAASYAMAAIATQGRVFVQGAQHLHMVTFLNKLREVGGGFNIKNEGIEFFYQSPLKGGLLIETDVHPGFMTDWQQPFVVLLTQSQGASVVHETVYEKRFGYTDMLKKMGADIEVFTHCLGGKECRFAKQNHTHSIVIKGKTPLSGAPIQIPDLRAGFAYVMAALAASGISQISGVQYLDRGYENLVKNLQSLGANISRQSVEPTTNPLIHSVKKDTISLTV